MKEKLLTTQQAAEFLSVNVYQVREYIKNGKLLAHRLGNGTGKRGSRRPWRIWDFDLKIFINHSSNIK
ncbi:hypothetical protein LCGC14_0543860 [marine sediment metagenome]|uniref:Helix-turn-helix domain-containing protein n=1 Tax=marine sediment metagenome TaxID=412755 RepID=A0A0F9SAL3_9ZZZZ